MWGAIWEVSVKPENDEALEDALETANLNGEIIDSISKLYWLIYRMNLETGTYEEISAGNEMHKLTGKHGKTEEAFQHAINTIVDGEHRGNDEKVP